MLAQSVAAILTQHMQTALRSYALRDRSRILAAYAVGCSVLADLMSQNVVMADWRSAGDDAMRRLVAACGEEELCAGDADIAVTDAVWLKRNFEGTPAYFEACRMFEAAIAEINHSRMPAKGSITTRAAMARLEAMAMNVAAFSNLAA